MVAEKGLDFEIVPVDLRTDAHKKPDRLSRPQRTLCSTPSVDCFLPQIRAYSRLILLILLPLLRFLVRRSLSARSPR
jgi:hypothetical protein